MTTKEKEDISKFLMNVALCSNVVYTVTERINAVNALVRIEGVQPVDTFAQALERSLGGNDD